MQFYVKNCIFECSVYFIFDSNIFNLLYFSLSTSFDVYIVQFAKDLFLLFVTNNTDMKNVSFSYLLPKSGSRS